MMERVLSWFENLVEPFPAEEPEQPPKGLWAFCWHYSKGIWPALLATAALAMSAAGLEIIIFSYLGNSVDWLSNANRETFLQTEYWTLVWM